MVVKIQEKKFERLERQVKKKNITIFGVEENEENLETLKGKIKVYI